MVEGCSLDTKTKKIVNNIVYMFHVIIVNNNIN